MLIYVLLGFLSVTSIYNTWKLTELENTFVNVMRMDSRHTLEMRTHIGEIAKQGNFKLTEFPTALSEVKKRQREMLEENEAFMDSLGQARGWDRKMLEENEAFFDSLRQARGLDN